MQKSFLLYFVLLNYNERRITQCAYKFPSLGLYSRENESLQKRIYEMKCCSYCTIKIDLHYVFFVSMNQLQDAKTFSNRFYDIIEKWKDMF